VNRADFQQLALLRITEAGKLLTLPDPMPDGAYYLAGYAVECALKACIAKQYGPETWPEKDFVVKCHTHNIFDLVRHAKLDGERDVATNSNIILAENWNIVLEWTERSRYDRHTMKAAQDIDDAVTDVVNGVLTGC
jgi:hypothetical protein